MHGWNGQILKVDLSNGNIYKMPLQENEARKYLGGRALGVKILLEQTKAGIDPLGAENTLVWATGPLTGAPFQGNSRLAIMAKSPLTHCWAESHVAGDFPIQLKRCGYDALIITGEAKKPVYLSIQDETVVLREATQIWGQETGTAERMIRHDLQDPNTAVAVIGPAGERGIKYSSIMCGRGHAAGRLGLGAVMGAKKLKAVAVRGTGKISIAQPEKLRTLAKKAREQSMSRAGKDLNEHGTAGGIVLFHEQGRVTAQNFRACEFPSIQNIQGEEITKRILVGKDACYACSVACKRVVRAEGRFSVDPAYGGPEYETIMSLGPLCGVDDLEAIAKANELCNRFGIDTISTGAVIAFAMECYEKGYISDRDTGGLPLLWGSADAVLSMIEMIADRRHIGDLLSKGTRAAAAELGTPQFAMQVKGLELAMHEPRWKKGLSLLYAVAARGATHMDAPADDWLLGEEAMIPEIGLDAEMQARDPHNSNREKVRTIVAAQNLYSLYDSLVICKYAAFPLGFTLDTLVEIFHAVTGWDASIEELITAAKRGIELTRVYLAREGFTRHQDFLPPRMHEGLPSGPSQGDCVSFQELERMKNDYYQFRGWTQENGWPTPETLRSLGLEWSLQFLPSP